MIKLEIIELEMNACKLEIIVNQQHYLNLSFNTFNSFNRNNVYGECLSSVLRGFLFNDHL